ncbi:ATP-binding protein [Cellulomonas sp. S1-8]|uniref:ATP-binding protein n=1 Tax=Cellulomonas sp. S1-8 TaxID=2904790 RepID=UPI002244675F|nr:ATP-binding protein [Cellulomonas sp. S1-8]UZN03774.1 AAA family ATPase [Cellulomonas sp. S1-8]
MSGFVGRARELDDLREQLAVVEAGTRDARGVAVLMRGRRRVGKSRLAEEFAERTGAPHVIFQAARHAPVAQELAGIADAVAASNLPSAALAAGNTPTTLTAALTLLAATLPDDRPSVVVIDEVPWLLEGIPGGAGELQRVWDRALSRKPVLLLLLGSDLAMMEQLTKADQPFHGRATEMVLHALSPRDVARMTGLTGVDAFDAHLITGGQPLIAQEWRHGETPTDFLTRSFGSSLSALVVSGTRVLDAEFPEGDLTRRVLTAVGDGERAFSKIQDAAGGLQPTSLHRVLTALITKRVVAADTPLSTATSRETRYRIADPSLRFWLPFVQPASNEVDRARPDLAMARVDRSFSTWRGRAVEPLVREGVSRLLLDTAWAHVAEVGGWWPRSNTPEIDLLGADRRPAKEVAFVGTTKWRTGAPVTRGEVAKLAVDARSVPGVTPQTPLVAVCPAGVEDGAPVAASWTADDLLNAWQ